MALIGVFTAGVGIKNFIENTIGNTAALGRTASDLNMNAKALAQWQLAAKRAGGTAEGITAALVAAQASVGSAKLGQIDASGQAFLQYAGQTGVDTKAIYSDADTLLKAQAEVIKRVRDARGEDVARTVAGQMGLGTNYNFLKQGATGVGQALKDQERLAATQAALVDKADALRKKWIDFENTLSDTAITVLTSLTPAFTRVLELFGQLAKWVDDHRTDISAWVSDAVEQIVKFIDQLNKAAEAVGGWKTVLIALAGLKILSMVSPLLALAGALGGVGGALAGIATSGVGALAILAGLGVVAEKERQRALDSAIPAGPDHDQRVAEAQAGGIVTPEIDGPSPGGYGKIGQWIEDTFFDKNKPRGVRNNNPGNIRGGNFAESHGATGKDDAGFAIFPSMMEGVQANRALLRGYVTGGTDTIRKIISKYAPASENNTKAYIDQVAKELGISPDATLNPSQLDAVSNAIFRMENGKKYAPQIHLGGKIPSPDDMTIQQMPTGAGASGPVVNNRAGNSSSSETNINGPIIINTKATDAKGIAAELPSAIKRADMTTHANSGVQ